MKKLPLLLLVLLTHAVYAQKKAFLEFQLAGIKSIATADFPLTGKTAIKSGSITPSLSLLWYRQVIRPHIYFTTGINLSFRNTRFNLNIDSSTYTGNVYTQPAYRIFSIPLLIGIQKKVDINFSPVAERKRTIGIATGFSVDFVKESIIRDGTTIRGRGFNIRTVYGSDFSFKPNTGIAYNLMLSLPLVKVGKHKSLLLTGIYKYPFYQQNTFTVRYDINGVSHAYTIEKLRLQEINIGLSFRFSD